MKIVKLKTIHEFVNGFQLDDLHFAGAVGQGDGDLVAGLVSLERPPVRRTDGHLPGLQLAAAHHQLHLLFLVVLAVQHGDQRTEPDLALTDILFLHFLQHGRAQQQLPHPRLAEIASLQRGGIVGVFRQVAVPAGDLDRLGQGHLQLLVELLKFGNDLLADKLDHGCALSPPPHRNTGAMPYPNAWTGDAIV